jgi:hypothetical protein
MLGELSFLSLFWLFVLIKTAVRDVDKLGTIHHIPFQLVSFFCQYSVHSMVECRMELETFFSLRDSISLVQ